MSKTVKIIYLKVESCLKCPHRKTEGYEMDSYTKNKDKCNHPQWSKLGPGIHKARRLPKWCPLISIYDDDAYKLVAPKRKQLPQGGKKP